MLHFFEIADNDYRLHIRINPSPSLKCALKISILMINFHFHIFKAIYNLELAIEFEK